MIDKSWIKLLFFLVGRPTSWMLILNFLSFGPKNTYPHKLSYEMKYPWIMVVQK